VARFLHVFPAGEVPLYGHHFHFREWIYGEVMTFKFLKTVLTTCRYAMCISLGVLSVSGTASATLIESIEALAEGAKYRVLFVTSTKRDATSTDIVDYNTFVNTAAQNGITGGLGLTWKALASTRDVSAMDNSGIGNADPLPVTIFNTIGQVVAISGADLWDGSLMNTVGFDEHGVYGSRAAFTGTGHTGFSGHNHVLGSGLYSYLYGMTNSLNPGWMGWDRAGGAATYSLYGVSGLVTKPIVEAPEPGTAILLSLGLAGLSFARYRKQS
jgi:hypothetical protein